MTRSDDPNEEAEAKQPHGVNCARTVCQAGRKSIRGRKKRPGRCAPRALPTPHAGNICKISSLQNTDFRAECQTDANRYLLILNTRKNFRSECVRTFASANPHIGWSGRILHSSTIRVPSLTAEGRPALNSICVSRDFCTSLVRKAGKRRCVSAPSVERHDTAGGRAAEESPVHFRRREEEHCRLLFRAQRPCKCVVCSVD